MEVNQQTKNLHLLNRACFGPSYRELAQLQDLRHEKLYKIIDKASAIKPKTLDTANSYVKNALLGPPPTMVQNMDKEEKKKYTAEQNKIISQNSNQDIKNLSILWQTQMADSEGQLREKLALFWHGHFACRINNSLYQQNLLDIIRQNAFEHFGDLLRAVSKSASMLAFLNNQQNSKKNPNENFAREVMELFTLGRGHYTEKDIKEAARAFTGWRFERNGTFSFQENIHDPGMKTVLGVTGPLNGDEVLDIILKQKQTAIFITQKLYKFFVNEKIDEGHIDWLATRFYNSDYNIRELMRDLFTSDWFYEQQNIGTHIKSPVEYFTGIRRFIPITIQNEEVQILLQRLLGQWLFNPPNVAGWPGGASWIDSSSLMLRLRIPRLIKNEESIELKPKTNDDVDMGNKEMQQANGTTQPKKMGGAYQIRSQIDWEKLKTALQIKNHEDLFPQLVALLLPSSLSIPEKNIILQSINHDPDAKDIPALVLALMSTPEYQLC